MADEKEPRQVLIPADRVPQYVKGMKYDELKDKDLKIRLDTALNGPTLIFDGVCNLCNGGMHWYFSRIESERKIHFMWCQHRDTAILLEKLMIDDIMQSWAYIENKEVYRASTAWLKACAHLKSPWRNIAPVLLWVPVSIRDTVYYFVARNRYTIFGQTNACQKPPPGLKEAMLHDTVAGDVKKED